MGRRHLSLGLALAAAAVILAAPAGAGVRFSELSRGTSLSAAPSSPTAVIVLDRAGGRPMRGASPLSRLAARLPAAGRTALAGVDFSRDAVVAVFADFGCKDARVAVTGMARRGAALVVSLVERPLAPGTMECQAIYPTYRLLAVPKASLGRPYPTRSQARLG